MKNICSEIFSVLQETQVNCVYFRLPHQASQIWVQESDLLDLFHSTNQEGFVFAPFVDQEEAPAVVLTPDLVFHETDWDDTLNDKINSLKNKNNKKELVLPPNIKKEEYLNQLEKAISSMPEKGIQKFIFSRIHIEESTLSASDIYKNLCEKYPNAFVYFIQLPEIGTWMGATPEILSTLNESKGFTTFSLAGTQPSLPKGEIYTWGEKEKDEQAFVTAYIETVLQEHKVPYELKGPETKVAGPVAHLLSTFTSSASHASPCFNSLLNALHPTPAVCGIPKQHAQDFILEVETHQRQYYTGFLGPIKQNQADLYVNLRCMQLFGQHLALYLGGGITLDSVPELEWRETELKAQTLLSVLS